MLLHGNFPCTPCIPLTSSFSDVFFFFVASPDLILSSDFLLPTLRFAAPLPEQSVADLSAVAIGSLLCFLVVRQRTGMSSAYLVIFFSISPPWVSCSTFIVGANSLVTESSCKSPLYNRASSPSPPTVCPSYRRFWCWHLAGGTSHLLLPQELDLILAPCWVLVAASLSLQLLSGFFFFELLYCFSTWTKQVL